MFGPGVGGSFRPCCSAGMRVAERNIALRSGSSLIALRKLFTTNYYCAPLPSLGSCSSTILWAILSRIATMYADANHDRASHCARTCSHSPASNLAFAPLPSSAKKRNGVLVAKASLLLVPPVALVASFSRCQSPGFAAAEVALPSILRNLTTRHL